MQPSTLSTYDQLKDRIWIQSMQVIVRARPVLGTSAAASCLQKKVITKLHISAQGPGIQCPWMERNQPQFSLESLSRDPRETEQWSAVISLLATMAGRAEEGNLAFSHNAREGRSAVWVWFLSRAEVLTMRIWKLVHYKLFGFLFLSFLGPQWHDTVGIPPFICCLSTHSS